MVSPHLIPDDQFCAIVSYQHANLGEIHEFEHQPTVGAGYQPSNSGQYHSISQEYFVIPKIETGEPWLQPVPIP